MVENHSKCRIWILVFFTNFCPIDIDLSGNTVWPQASGFQKVAKMDHFLATPIVKVTRFARNVEWDFLWDLFSNTLDLISKI